MHAQLSAKYPGVIVPPLPEKQSATVQTMRVSGVGFSAEWLEERRSQLQRFVQRVVCHPTLHTAPDLQTFLEASEQTLESWKESSKQVKVPSAASVLTDVKSGLLSSYTRGFSMLGGEAPPAFELVQGEWPRPRAWRPRTCRQASQAALLSRRGRQREARSAGAQRRRATQARQARSTEHRGS